MGSDKIKGIFLFILILLIPFILVLLMKEVALSNKGLSIFFKDKNKENLVREKTNEEKPEVDVPYDLVVEENVQKSVDEGHSPWRLDPVFVTQVFVSLLISPEGIIGDYPIAYDDIQIIRMNQMEAITFIDGEETPANKVYLKRLIRQDDTGIWTVVGYDRK